MRIVSKLTLAALALGLCTTAASAAVNFSSPTSAELQLNAPAGYTTVMTFDSAPAAGWSFTGGITQSVTNSTAAEPAGDTSVYGAAEPGNSLAVFAPKDLTDLSVYIGSLDSYNTISFYDSGTLVQSFTGTQLALPISNGDQVNGLTNRRYDFTFSAGSDVNEIVFASTEPAFEIDNLAIAGVPEPATWAMMILGFCFVGFMMRSNRQKAGLAAV
jgi:PEP-CTERM motif